MGRYIEAAFPGVAGNSLPDFPDPLGIQLGDTKPSLGLHDHNQNYAATNLTNQDPGDLFGLLNGIGTAPHTDLLNSEYGDGLQYIMEVENSTNAYGQRITEVYNAGSNSSTTYPSNYLARQLRTVARLISGGGSTKIYLTHIGGFDTHANQIQNNNPHLGLHSVLLSEVFDSIKAFHEDLTNMGLQERVMVSTFSEFGRRAKQNGSLGTDHGTVAPLFLVGTGVQPGVSGTNPDLSNLTSSGVLLEEHQSDYRSVFKTLLQDWLGADDVVLNDAQFGPFNKEPGLVSPSFTVDPSCYIGPLSPLPVTLSLFTAEVYQEEQVKVDWTTASEYNHDYFMVERSADGIDFEDVERIYGKGEPNQVQSYGIIDPEPLPGVSYYRLKSVGTDQEFTYSEIRAVELKDKTLSHYKVYPNPAVYDAQVVMTTALATSAYLKVYSIDGTLVHSREIAIEKGFNKFSLDVTGFTAGHYVLKVESDRLAIPATKLLVSP